MTRPNTSTPQERVDHVAEARIILKAASEEPAEEVQPIAVAEAQAHASLAIADELRGIREAVTGFDAAKIEDALITEIAHVGREITEIVWRANGGRS